MFLCLKGILLIDFVVAVYVDNLKESIEGFQLASVEVEWAQDLVRFCNEDIMDGIREFEL